MTPTPCDAINERLILKCYLSQIKGGIENGLEDAEIVDQNPLGQPQGPINIPQDSYPNLIAVAMKNLPATENEWIVVYSFFASKFGKEIFNRAQIIELYKESRRFDQSSTTRQLSIRIKRVVQAGYINPLGEEFAMLDEGVKLAKEILARTKGTIASAKSSTRATKETQTEADEGSKTRVRKRGSNLKRLDIDLNPKGKESLEAFYKRYPTTNNHQRNLLFIYYLQEILGIGEVSVNHVYTCYDSLELQVSEDLPQTLRNTKSKTGWININNSLLTLAIKGKNKIKAWAEKDKA